MAKKAEYKEYSVAELEKAIRESEDELVSLRLRKQTGQVEKSHQLRELRKRIARLKTYLHQKNKAADAVA